MKKLITFSIIVLVVGSLAYLGTTGQGHFEHHSVMEEIAHAHYNGGEISMNENLDTSKFLKVHSKIKGVNPFYTQLRSAEMISYPCQNCHTVALDKLQSKNAKKSHWDIEIVHAGTEVMNCITCHNEKDLNVLTSLSGQAISFDKSFELCGQCHSTQFKDWQGGAHGKTLSGWKPPRVAKTCVNCHNPHNPAIKSRWPSRLVKKEQLNLE